MACVIAIAAGCGRRGAVAPGVAEPISLAVAHQVFAEAAARCGADQGALWGVSLCGPIMVVDRDSRFVVANQGDELDKLRRDREVFVGVLAADDTIANTAVTWSGVRWTQLGWPLPDDAARRDVLVMHEAFHRIAEQAGVPQLIAGDCAHLETVDGRYYLQLEWRALTAALAEADDAARRAAVSDALGFRQARRAMAPDAGANEDALELNEGLAEYTGVVVGRGTPAERQAAALADLAAHVDDPSFVRSFAYATGPALGLLLDQYVPGWRKDIARTTSLSAVLQAAIPAAPKPDEARYDGAALRAAEQARAAEHGKRLAAYRTQLVDGPVLRLGFRHMKIEFDPRDVIALDRLGSVYPTLRVIDAWGVLEVTGGALLAADYTAVTVAAPPGPSTSGVVIGPGFTLKLAAGWHLVPGPRAGDVQLAPP